jgi:uncharacterized membrane protein
MEAFFINICIPLCYILLAVAVATAIIFPLIQLVKNPKNAMGVLMGIVGLVVVFGVSYALSDDVHMSKIEISSQGAKLAETGIFVFYILIVTAFVGVIYSGVAKFFK